MSAAKDQDVIDAVNECRDRILAGGADPFAEIADEYDLREELVRRKFHERFSGGIVPVPVAAQKPTLDDIHFTPWQLKMALAAKKPKRPRKRP